MEKKRYFDAMTGLKGIFIFVIVWFHTLPKTPLIGKIPMTSFIRGYGGMLGNYMFFMLSGFLIAYGYRDRIRGREVSFGQFLRKRLCKLYPLYLLSNAVMLAGDVMQNGVSAINLKKIVFTILLQNGGGLETAHPYNVPGWFVSALFVCYMAYFFVAFWAKNPTQYACMIAFGVIWGYSIAIGGRVPPLCFGQNGESFLNFFLGCALAEIYPQLAQRTRKWLQPAAAFVLVASGYLLMRYGVEVISGDSKVAFAFLICPLTIYLAAEENLFSKFLRLKPVAYLGKISMSVYFWHAVIYSLFAYFCSMVSGETEIGDVQYLVYLVLLLLCSMLSSRFLERGKKIHAFWERSFT